MMRRVALGIGALAAVAVLGAGTYAFGDVDRGTARWSDRPATTGASQVPVPTASDSPSAAPEAGAAGPSPTPSRKPTGTGRKDPPMPAGCPQGERQREVETALAALGGYGPVQVDGVQSATDCAAIKKFQQRFGIGPSNGSAGRTTADVARRILASTTAPERARCGAGAGLTVCIDLSLQTIWVVRDGAVVYGPTVARTGFRGYATPPGTYRINYRNIREWSEPYEVWMPYWQQFYRGMGLHETTNYIHNPAGGSHGCVNLLRTDARALWSLVGVGTTVRIFGRRPGT